MRLSPPPPPRAAPTTRRPRLQAQLLGHIGLQPRRRNGTDDRPAVLPHRRDRDLVVVRRLQGGLRHEPVAGHGAQRGLNTGGGAQPPRITLSAICSRRRTASTGSPVTGPYRAVFGALPRRDQRRWDACCLRGLMLDGQRKSTQAMVERAAAGREQAAALQQSGHRRCVDSQVRPDLGRGRPPVLRSPGGAGELPGRGQCPCCDRYGVLSARLAVGRTT